MALLLLALLIQNILFETPGLTLSFVLFAFMSLCFLISSQRLALDKKCYVIALCAIYYIFVVKKC